MVVATKPVRKVPARAAKAPARAVNQGGERTRVRILDAAEQLFSEHGLDGVSLREIAARAKAPLALANYHFKSKEGLYRAALERRIVAVSAERRAALARASKGRRGPATIEAVLEALARPWVELRSRPGGLAYTQLLAREAGDPAEGRRGIIGELLDPIAREFILAMEQALPGMPRQRVNWAYHFFIGALLIILANPDRVVRLSGRRCDVASDRAVIREIVTFFSAALAAPAGLPKQPATTSRSKK